MDQTGNFNGNLNGIKSISWNKNILETDMLAVGGYDYNTRYRKPEGLAIMYKIYKLQKYIYIYINNI